MRDLLENAQYAPSSGPIKLRMLKNAQCVTVLEMKQNVLPQNVKQKHKNLLLEIVSGIKLLEKLNE